MPRHGKRYLNNRKLLEGNGEYDAAEALDLVTRMATARFDETVEVAVKLGVDPRQADQMVRGVTVLPHGTGRARRVLVFAKGEKAKEAEEAGADYVGAEDVVAKIEGGWLEFEAAVATPDMMGAVSKLGKILGPKGLMPNPKAGTVTFEVGRAVREIKAGKIEYRVDKTGIVHVPIGKVSFGHAKLLDNFLVLLDALIRSKPSAARGQYLRSISMSSTMGPGVKVNVQKALGALASK